MPDKAIPALELKIKAYPNPSPNEFLLVLEGGDAGKKAEVLVRDMYGHTVFQTVGAIFDTFRFGGEFAGGVYLVEVRNANLAQTLKVVKAK